MLRPSGSARREQSQFLPRRPPGRDQETPRLRPARAIPQPALRGYRMPAEWEAHAATWIAWPHQVADWPRRFAPIPWVSAEVVRHLSVGERVRILVTDATAERSARQLL